MQKNDEFILDITDVTAEGSGVGKYNGMAVFVPLTAVGDTVRVKALKVKKSYAYARLIEIITPAQSRQAVDCSVFERCGGCVYRHITYSAECELKRNKVYEAVKRIGGIDLPPEPIIFEPETYGYRNKAQYPLSLDGKAGFYAFHSHRIIPCATCKLQPKVFGEIVSEAERWIAKYGISIYNETAHSGLLRHIYIRIAEKTGEIMLTLVINGKALPYTEELVKAVEMRIGKRLDSVYLNFNTEKTNVILGKECQLIYGVPYITDELCGIKVRLSPLSFYQVNRKMAERIYRKAAEYAEPDGKSIIDLYCGAGTIGLSMARRAKSVIGIEIIPEAVSDAEFNAESNGIKNAEFICGDAAAGAKRLAQRGISSDVVVVDPPRKGCSEELIGIIATEFSPERVVYVSCDPATLARDIAIFSQHGYELKEYTPADLFPRTAHVETVCLLSRNEK